MNEKEELLQLISELSDERIIHYLLQHNTNFIHGCSSRQIIVQSEEYEPSVPA